MKSGTILVTGGTGKTGGQTAKRLAELGYSVRIASRSAQGSDAVHFDWANESTFPAALEGISAVYLVAPVLVLDPLPLMSRFIDRAQHCGVRRFVLLSASSLPEGGPAMGGVHKLLRESTPEWTVLQPSWFMENFSSGQHLPTIRDQGIIVSATGRGRVPFIAVKDIANVAVRALTDEVPHNAAHLITGPEALSYAEAAEIIALAAGVSVRHHNVTAGMLTERWIAMGVDRQYASMLAGMDEAIASGSEDRVTSTVETVTGRRPQSLLEFAREHACAWRQPD